MRILGLDLGQKRIGVAISDPLGITAQGLMVIDGEDHLRALERIQELCRLYKVRKIVVGLPLRMDGSRGPAAEKAEQFKEILKQKIGLPVVTVDERLTSKAAEKVLLAGNVRRKKRKGLRDKLAAVLILDRYLRIAEAGRDVDTVQAESHKPEGVKKMPGKEENNEAQLVTLEDEAGNEHDFAVEDIFEYRDKRYAVLVPFSDPFEEKEEEEMEAYIFRVEQVEGEDVLVEVEDEDEWEQAVARWETLEQDLESEFDGDESLN